MDTAAQRNVARSVTESLVSSGTTPGAQPSVQRVVLISSRNVERATANGYLDFKPQPDNSCGEHHPRLSEVQYFRARRQRRESSMQTLAELPLLPIGDAGSCSRRTRSGWGPPSSAAGPNATSKILVNTA